MPNQKTLAEISRKYDTDKSSNSGYIQNFELHFERLRDDPIRLLEIGVYRGGSLLMWKEYFSKGLIVGIDIEKNPLVETPERIRFYQGSQDDTNFLNHVAHECAPQGFDIIIDDASHIGTLTRISFHNLFANHLKPWNICH